MSETLLFSPIRKERTVTLTVKDYEVDVKVDKESLYVGETAKVTVTHDAGNDADVKIAVSENATLAEDGTLTAKAAGKVTITVSCEGKFEVTKEVEAKANFVTVTEETITLKVGESTTLTVEGSSQKVVWSSSDENVVTVDANGKVTAVGEGTATVKAVSGDVSVDIAATVEAAAPTPYSTWSEDFSDATLVAGVPTDNASLNYATYTYNEDGYGEIYADANYRGLALVLNNADNGSVANFAVSMKVKKISGTAENMRIMDPSTYQWFTGAVAVGEEWVTLACNIEVAAGQTLKIQVGSADEADLTYAVDDIVVERYTDWTKPNLWTSWSEDFSDETLEAGVPTDAASLNYSTYTYNEEGYGEVYADANYRGFAILLNNMDNTSASSFVASVKVKKISGDANNMRIMNPSTYEWYTGSVAVGDEWVTLTTGSIEVAAGESLLIQVGSADEAALTYAVDDVVVTRTIE